MKTKKQFILDTLLPYKKDHSICGYDTLNKSCTYLTDDGRKCAVGKHLKEGEWQNSTSDVETLSFQYDLNEILTEEANKQDLSLREWSIMQQYHDNIAIGKGNTIINNSVKLLERATGETFEELIIL